MAFRFGSHEESGEDSPAPDNNINNNNNRGPADHHRRSSQQQRSFDEDDGGRASKRQRTALACNSCRYRKSRCNGVHPTCSTCSDLGLECVYRGPAPTPRFQSRDLQSMERRLQKFEDLLLGIVNSQQVMNNNGNNSNNMNNAALAMSQFGSHLPPAGPSVVDASAQQSTPVPAFASPVRFHPEQATTTTTTIQRDQPMSKLWPMAQEDTVDGMGSIVFSDDSSSGFFGPSSNSSFFSKIAKVLALGIKTMPEGRDSTRDLACALSRPASPPAQSRGGPRPVNPYKLPSRAEVSRLIDIFFRNTGHFFPYISKTSLTDMVDELELTNFSNVRKSGLCLLNAVFAMATSFDGDSGRHPKAREIESDVFFQRAMSLSPWTISNTANLETLQALTVMTQYLQGTSRSAQTWKLHGLLVQAAFQLGVHTQDPNARISALEREIRTRIWYTCIILDRIFSTTFGRPLLINNELIHIDMPLDLELEQLPKDPSQSEISPNSNSRPSAGVVFIPSIKLYQIQGDIIRYIYNHNVIISSHDLRSDELYSKIIELDHALERWKADLPPGSELLPLEFIQSMDTESWTYPKVQNTMTLRYLNVRALLFRKVLEHSLDQVAKSGASVLPLGGSLPIGEIMIQACADACVQTITIIRATARKPHVLPAWWYTVYYVFNSALILFGVICLQTLGKANLGTKAAGELLVVIQSGLEALEITGKDTRLVRRCSKYLTKIILVSTLLVRNHVSAQQLPADVTALINSLPNVYPPSTSGGNTPTPLNTDFGQFLIDEDYAFLDVWTDLVQDTATGVPNA
ncbi:hypothetical protein AYL99_11484 [Fonsecaea erecta]|uniref:Zn(2)-C6 fungal-type domain-containing protein n=1 Tax=Fonsecaea erecta TaxID=1367422 RepID=A0A178Z5C7_9EURO|nr:hypothetical protein AYL99_11484 [Fonsecaea erecta]OAP54383.1 hypothetical protein AYL99_11484 [Fonsecaea erecta]